MSVHKWIIVFENMYLILADFIVFLHFLFIVYVLFGGLLIYKWRKMIYPHMLALLWGFYIEITGSICPLTPLEVKLRVLGGVDPYEGGFISHYLVTLIYPQDYDINLRIVGTLILVSCNVVIYGLYYWRKQTGK